MATSSSLRGGSPLSHSLFRRVFHIDDVIFPAIPEHQQNLSAIEEDPLLPNIYYNPIDAQHLVVHQTPRDNKKNRFFTATYVSSALQTLSFAIFLTIQSHWGLMAWTIVVVLLAMLIVRVKCTRELTNNRHGSPPERFLDNHGSRIDIFLALLAVAITHDQGLVYCLTIGCFFAGFGVFRHRMTSWKRKYAFNDYAPFGAELETFRWPEGPTSGVSK